MQILQKDSYKKKYKDYFQNQLLIVEAFIPKCMQESSKRAKDSYRKKYEAQKFQNQLCIVIAKTHCQIVNMDFP